jgi:tetratricopeptide (TPR) repeat protein
MIMMSPLSPPSVKSVRLDSGGALTWGIFVITVIFYLLSINSVYAENEREGDPTYIFYKGNTYYEDGQYDKAINEYVQLLEQGYESGNLYFNLGNSYFKKGKLGQAILNYEKARRLIPRDGDLKSNYQFALSKIKYNVTEESSWFQRANNKFNMFTINELTIILSCIFMSIFLIMILSIFIKKAGRYFLIFLALLLIIFIPFTFTLYNKIEALDKEAIVIAENVEAKFEPMGSATTHFTLYEGMKIYLLDLNKEWIKIRRHDGKVGWINDKDMEKI